MNDLHDDLSAAKAGPEHSEIPRICPACGAELTVIGLECESCHACIKGQFSPGQLARLPKEQQQFIITFMKNGGKISAAEQELKISYPTVRAKLEQIQRHFGGLKKGKK